MFTLLSPSLPAKFHRIFYSLGKLSAGVAEGRKLFVQQPNI
jgi:hypothetical protein